MSTSVDAVDPSSQETKPFLSFLTGKWMDIPEGSRVGPKKKS